jgi:glycopeptide antibiotics resistance protein
VGRPVAGGDGRRQRFLVWARPAAALLIALHLTSVYWLAQRSMSGTWIAAGSVVPLQTIRAYLALGPAGAVQHLGGELLLLAPLGVLLPLVGGRVDAPPAYSFARTAFGGLMLAFGAEVVRTGVAGQAFDVDVVLLNALGIALAHLAIVPAGRAALRRRGWGPAPDLQPAAQDPAASAALPRVGVAP